MRPLSRLVPGAGALVLLLLLPAPAIAAAPTLLSAVQNSSRLTATWSLPPGVETEQLVASARATPDSTFGLASPEFIWNAPGDLTPAQTSFTSPERFDPGTWYVRVGGIDSASPVDTQWSNILRFVVPKPPAAKPRTGRYRGRTEFPDSRRIGLTLSRDRRRVRKLLIRFRLDCQRGGFPVGQFLARLEFKPIRVRKGLRFSKRGSARFRGGGMVVKVRGRFRPPTRVTGTLTAKARLPGGVTCVYFPLSTVKWSARAAGSA